MSIISATAAAGSVGAFLTGGSGSLLPYNVIVPDWAVSAMQALTATLILLYASLGISQAVASLSPSLYQGMTGVMKKKTCILKSPTQTCFCLCAEIISIVSRTPRVGTRRSLQWQPSHLYHRQLLEHDESKLPNEILSLAWEGWEQSMSNRLSISSFK